MKDIPRNLKPYFLAVFRPGQRWNQVEGAEDLPTQQLSFLRAQFEAGAYRAAGPAIDGGEIVAIAILEAESLEAARKMAGRDPGVMTERLAVTLHSILLPSLDVVRAEY